GRERSNGRPIAAAVAVDAVDTAAWISLASSTGPRSTRQRRNERADEAGRRPPYSHLWQALAGSDLGLDPMMVMMMVVTTARTGGGGDATRKKARTSGGGGEEGPRAAGRGRGNVAAAIGGVSTQRVFRVRVCLVLVLALWGRGQGQRRERRGRG